MKVLVDGASDASDLPGFDPSEFPGDIFYAPDEESLQEHLPPAALVLPEPRAPPQARLFD
jgi:hypothetical protein